MEITVGDLPLPTETMYQIFDYLDDTELLSSITVCKRWKYILNDIYMSRVLNPEHVLYDIYLQKVQYKAIADAEQDRIRKNHLIDGIKKMRVEQKTIEYDLFEFIDVSEYDDYNDNECNIIEC